jgi:hypothetical protein
MPKGQGLVVVRERTATSRNLTRLSLERKATLGVK